MGASCFAELLSDLHGVFEFHRTQFKKHWISRIDLLICNSNLRDGSNLPVDYVVKHVNYK